MTYRISATVSEDIEKLLDNILKNKKHRNKSHIIEDAIRFFHENLFAKEEKNDKNKK